MSQEVLLPVEVSKRLRAFRRASQFAERGGVVTDLDGTAVHELDGRVYVAERVAEGLKALVDLGRPVVVNTLRFPLNVIRTFGREWGAITNQPVPLVSLNGAVLGLLTPVGEAETTFDELAAFPLSPAELEQAVFHVEELMVQGLHQILLFIYPRDWRQGEIIWTPHVERTVDLQAKYLSASRVVAGPVAVLGELLKGYGMGEDEVRAAAAAWRLFNALNYAPEVARALQADDQETLERIRTRFSGALDLFGEA